MKLKLLTSFLTLCLVGLFAFNFMDDRDRNADVTPTVSSNVTQGDTTPPAGFPFPTKFNWDYSSIPGVNGGTVGACQINGNYILNRWNNTSFYRFDNTGPGGGPGSLTDSGTYTGAIRDMTIYDGVLWGGKASGTLYKMNPTTLATITTFSTAAQFRAIAWDPNRKGFWGTNFSGNILCYDTAGVLRGTVTSALTGKYGMGFDSTSSPDSAFLWVWNQQGTGMPNDLVQYHIASNSIVNTYTFGASDLSGGAEVEVIGGNLCLFLNWQNAGITGYDMGPAGPGPGNEVCFTRGPLWKSLPDNTPFPGGISDTINNTTHTGTLSNVTVEMDLLTHTWCGDIAATITHGGVTDTLIARPGPGTFGANIDDFVDAKLTDAATMPIEAIVTGVGPVTGDFLPGGSSGVDSLSKFNGMEGAGEWILRVSDNALGDTGALQGWTLCLTSPLWTQIISSNNTTPDRYELSQNYPNPFNPSTKINFAIPQAGLVSLAVYDVLGREVQSLISENLGAGSYIAEFDGAGLSSGTYFYRLQVGDFVQVKRMVLLK